MATVPLIKINNHFNSVNRDQLYFLGYSLEQASSSSLSVLLSRALISDIHLSSVSSKTLVTIINTRSTELCKDDLKMMLQRFWCFCQFSVNLEYSPL